MLGRGLRRRCGRCGAGSIFETRYRLRERCPRCGYRFVREPGAFTGVMLLNFVVTLGLMFLVLVAWVAWRGVTGTAAPLWPFAVACLTVAAVAPIVAYPFATSTWAALDLAMRPLDADEELEALAHARPG